MTCCTNEPKTNKECCKIEKDARKRTRHQTITSKEYYTRLEEKLKSQQKVQTNKINC